ncbi:Tim10/DDP family zinc finger-domain-containing protein [Dichotomocladium elegans]|nr:Tim10/DDP family zinc finger-domain-containing protein [Dichotomocladium elegans]
MSFFGGGLQPQQQTVNPQNIAMAEQELDMVTDMFNRIAESCHTKCITKNYDLNDLTQAESVCIDRCVAKFFDAYQKVGEKMQQMGQQNMR